MRIDAEKSVALLGEIIRISNSTLDIDRRLALIMEEIGKTFRLRASALYVLDMDHGGLNLKAAMGSRFREALALNEGPIKFLVRENQGVLFDERPEDSAFFTGLIEGGPEGAGIFPVMDDRFFYGSLLLVPEARNRFDDRGLALIRPITQEIAGTMRNAQLYANTREMVDDLMMTNELWNTLSSTLRLGDLLDKALFRTLSALKVRCGVIEIFEGPDRTAARCRYCEGAECDFSSPLPEPLLLKLKGLDESAFLRDLMGEDKEQAIETTPGDTAIAPVRSAEGLIGYIALKGKGEKGRVGKREMRLFSTIAGQVSAAVTNALLHEKMERLNREKELVVHELSNLFELNKAVMTTIELDRLLHIILTAVTIGDGFGFNRAMLFLYNDKTGFIQGMMGVGPDSAEEAWRVWSEIGQARKTLQTVVNDADYDKLPYSSLNEMVKGMRISVSEKSILSLTVREKIAFNITNAGGDPRVNPDLLGRLGCNAFATAPLMASGRVVGVLLVDNIYNRRPISDEDIRLLTIFANQAGVAIENSILYRNLQEAHRELRETQGKLIHTEKLAALGEMAAGVAHEIRNPLVSIGGFARRLARKIEGGEDRKYIDIICKEAERLENILNEILIFSREEQVEMEEQDINAIIADTLQFFAADFERGNIEILMDLGPEIGGVRANYHQLKQVFINLFANARHAMAKGGVLRVRSFATGETGVERAVVEVIDTGGGIPYNVMANIFNPFFTTKSDGTGLGLAITHKILTHYGGEIEVINNDVGGATFIITIPAAEKKTHRHS